jgi:hypothetical protein
VLAISVRALKTPHWHHLIQVSFDYDIAEKNVAEINSLHTELREWSYAIGE